MRVLGVGNDECPHPELGERSLCCMQSSPAVRPIVGFFVRKKNLEKIPQFGRLIDATVPPLFGKNEGQGGGTPLRNYFFRKKR